MHTATFAKLPLNRHVRPDAVPRRNGLNLGPYEKWMTINRFDTQHTGDYTCRPIPPQNVQSPPLLLDLGREYSQRRMYIKSNHQCHIL